MTDSLPSPGTPNHLRPAGTARARGRAGRLTAILALTAGAGLLLSPAAGARPAATVKAQRLLEAQKAKPGSGRRSAPAAAPATTTSTAPHGPTTTAPTGATTTTLAPKTTTPTSAGSPSTTTPGSPTTTFPPGPPGAISGRVTAADTGQAAGGICVSAAQTQGSGLASAKTAADGTYTIGGLAPGRYRVKFRDCVNGLYAEQYYDGKPDNVTADLVTVNPSQTTSGIDAALSRATTPGTSTPGGSTPPKATGTGSGGTLKAASLMATGPLARTGWSPGLLVVGVALFGCGTLLVGADRRNRRRSRRS